MPIDKTKLDLLLKDFQRNGTFSHPLSEPDAAYIEQALECWSIVEQLRAPEGAEVALFCDNPEPIAGTSPNNAIEICDDWTGWKRRRFEGDSILDALRGATAAHDAHVEIERAREALKNQERKDSGR